MSDSTPFFRPRNGNSSTHVWNLYEQLSESQWWDPDTLLQYQLARLRRLMLHCTGTSSYYQCKWSDANVDVGSMQTLDDFRRLPILTRREYQEHFASICTNSLPNGQRPLASLTTSGTSGIPIEVQQTDLTQLWWQALLLRDLEWCGIDPRGSLASIRPIGTQGKVPQRQLNGISLASWGPPLDTIVEVGECHAMDIRQGTTKQFEWLQRVDADYLISYPSNVEALAQFARRENQELQNLQVIQTIAETLTNDQRETIDSTFHVPVRNTYSANEAGYVASPCPLGEGLHIHAESVLLELLNDEDEPCEAGEVGRVVITPLHNFASPMIRYDIMDEAVMDTKRCGCGRKLPTLRSAMGKRRPILSLPQGVRKNSTELVLGIRAIGGASQFQILYDKTQRVVVNIMPSTTWGDDHCARITALVEEFVMGSLPAEVVVCEQLERTAGGKFVDVIVSRGHDDKQQS